MSRLILGVDAGNYMAKVVGTYGTDLFRTNICDWFEREVEETFGADDMEFTIGKRKGFAGTIAMFEDEFGNGSTYGDTKAHEDNKIRVLLAINRYLDKYCSDVGKIAIVTGQPIIRHTDAEKKKIQQMLMGNHEVKVNGKTRSFYIESVGVAPEGSAAHWANQSTGLIRILDIGSGTVNAATISDNRHLNNASTTFNFGMETIKDKSDMSTIARGIIRNTTKLKWNKSDKVLICGGIAEGIAPHLIEHYSNGEIINPTFKSRNGVKILSPIYANAVGYYEIAKGAFG